MVKVTKEVLDKCKKALIEHSANWYQGVCNGLVATLPEGTTYLASSTVCHSWVSGAFVSTKMVPSSNWSTEYKKGAKPFLILDCHPQSGARSISCSREAANFLILWIARESPFSKYVLNKDDEESLLKGGIILLCGPKCLSHAEAMWICKILRFKTEGQQAADVFMDLVKSGVDGMLALYVASLIRTKVGATFGYTGPERHSTVVEEYTSAKGFVTRKLNKDANCTSEVFGGTFSECYFTKIKGFCKPIKKSDGWGGTTTGEGVSDLIKRVLEWQEKEFGTLLKPVSVPKSPDNDTVYLEVDM